MKNIFILSFICANVFSQPAPGNQHKTCKNANVANHDKCANQCCNSGPVYEVATEKDVHAMFAGGTWIGGLDPGGLLHVAADTFKQNGSDFWPGPIDTINISPFSSSSTSSNKFWRVDC